MNIFTICKTLNELMNIKILIGINMNLNNNNIENENSENIIILNCILMHCYYIYNITISNENVNCFKLKIKFDLNKDTYFNITNQKIKEKELIKNSIEITDNEFLKKIIEATICKFEILIKNYFKEDNKDEEEDDIKVEDSNDTKNNISTSSTSSNNYNNYNTYNNNNINNNINNNFNQPPHLNQDYINQARNQINNMSDEQLNLMVTQMKMMDNQTMKNMMAAQGMNLTDQQIDMMKMSLTPETLKMMRNPNFNPPNINNNLNNNINNNNINNNNTGNNMPPQMPQMPNLANMDFQQMLDFIKKNPDLLKMISPQLSQMMGGKNIDPEIMMKSMEKIMWIFSIPGRIKRFMLSWRGVCFIIFIIAIFYGLFKRK
jgi:hypothetical protein